MQNIFTILIIYTTILINNYSKAVKIKDVNWCGSPYCKEKINHTICKWGLKCPAAKYCATTLEFNKKMKDFVMELHNKKRNKIALGEEYRVPENVKKAANMNILQWHVHLEFVARCYSRQCSSKHDQCRAVPDFDQVGQNIFSAIYKTNDSEIVNNIQKILEDAVNTWFQEISNVPEEIYHKWEKTDHQEDYEHYTQLIWADTTHIGCGLSHRKENKDIKFYLICNYGNAGNIPGDSIYTVGESCSKCSNNNNNKACNSEFKGLCGNIQRFAYKCPCEETIEDNDYLIN